MRAWKAALPGRGGDAARMLAAAWNLSIFAYSAGMSYGCGGWMGEREREKSRKRTSHVVAVIA